MVLFYSQFQSQLLLQSAVWFNVPRGHVHVGLSKVLINEYMTCGNVEVDTIPPYVLHTKN
jgi:hypothetical protein